MEQVPVLVDGFLFPIEFLITQRKAEPRTEMARHKLYDLLERINRLQILLPGIINPPDFQERLITPGIDIDDTIELVHGFVILTIEKFLVADRQQQLLDQHRYNLRIFFIGNGHGVIFRGVPVLL